MCWRKIWITNCLTTLQHSFFIQNIKIIFRTVEQRECSFTPPSPPLSLPFTYQNPVWMKMYFGTMAEPLHVMRSIIIMWWFIYISRWKKTKKTFQSQQKLRFMTFDAPLTSAVCFLGVLFLIAEIGGVSFISLMFPQTLVSTLLMWTCSVYCRVE